MSGASPFSLRIFVADGDPDGLRVVERSNWIGKALIFPRALLPRVKSRDELGRVILMLAHRFDEIGNADIQPYRAEHPREIGVRLKQFVDAGWLEKGGHGRGTRYHWPKQRRGDLLVDAGGGLPSSQHKEPSSQHKADGSQHKPDQLQHYETLRTLAEPVRARRRTQPQVLRSVILALCATEPLSLLELSDLLGRAPASLQNHYLTPMLKEGALQLLYPHHPSHPQQRYRAQAQGTD